MRNKLGQFIKGEKHPNWKGGIWSKNPEQYQKALSHKHYLLNKEAYKIKGKRRRQEKKKEILNYQRKHVLNPRNKIYTSITKRDYPKDNKCELCNHIKKLAYHHFNNNELKKYSFINGMWLCNTCHFLAEAIDKNKNIAKKYLKLKNKLQESLNELIEKDDI